MSLTTILKPTRAPRARVDHAGVSAAEAVRAIPNGARIFVHGAAATPTPLLEALVARGDLEGVTLYHLHTSGPASFAAPEVADRFRSVSFFVGPALRLRFRRRQSARRVSSVRSHE
jgi:hypothetical protein